MIFKPKALPTLFATILAAAIGLSQPARADQYYNLIRFACVPKIGFFSMQTFGLWNLQDFGLEYETRDLWTEFAEAQWDQLESHGIYELSRIAGKPYRCRLTDREIAVVVYDYVGFRERGQCASIDFAKFLLRVDGTIVAESDNTNGGCPHGISHDLRISADAAWHCYKTFDMPWHTVEAKEFTPVETLCRKLELPD